MIFKKFVINLDRRPDRMDEFWDRYGGRDVERFSGVDGKAFVEGGHSNGLLEGLRKRGYPNIGGVFGCWSSHLGIWEFLSGSDADAFIIFEDDVFLCSDFDVRFTTFLSYINSIEFDLIYFGGRFQENFRPKTMNNWEAVGDLFKMKSVASGHAFDRGTFAYVLSKNGAKKLLDFYKSDISKKIKILPVDGWINGKRMEMDVFDVFPHLAYSPMNYKSDVQRVR